MKNWKNDISHRLIRGHNSFRVDKLWLYKHIFRCFFSIFSSFIHNSYTSHHTTQFTIHNSTFRFVRFQCFYSLSSLFLFFIFSFHFVCVLVSPLKQNAYLSTHVNIIAFVFFSFLFFFLFFKQFSSFSQYVCSLSSTLSN